MPVNRLRSAASRAARSTAGPRNKPASQSFLLLTRSLRRALDCKISLVASDKEFRKIIATLKRAMDLPLTQPQRGTLKELCQEIVGGSNEQEAQVPSFRLKEEADGKRAALARAEAAEQRVKELEEKLEEAVARRSWWRR